LEITLTTIDENGIKVPVSQSATISLDKLSFNCKATDCLKKKLLYLLTTHDRQIVSDKVTLSPNFSAKEKGYRYIVDVLFRGEVYVQLAFYPTMNAMPDDHVKVKICNHALYESRWVENVGEILRSLNLECYTITELHIALDSSEVVEKFLNLYYSPELQLVRAGLFGKLNKVKRLTTKSGFHFNKRVSDLYIAFYDKSRDYLEKPYIKAFHELNDVRNNVQRIEIRTRKISMLKIAGFEWQDLGSEDLLSQIFKMEFQSRIVFNHMNNPTFSKSRNRTYVKVFPIEIPVSTDTIVLNAKCKPATGSIKALKNTVKNIHLHTVLNPDEHNLSTLREIISKNNLGEWYKMKSRTWRTPVLKFEPAPVSGKSFKWLTKLLTKFVVIDLPEWKTGHLLPDYLVDLKAA